MLLACTRAFRSFVLVISPSVPYFAFAQTTPTPAQLVEASNSASDPLKLGAYQLKADVVVRGDNNKATGMLTVDRDQENARQELEFRDYQEVRLYRGQRSYVVQQSQTPIDFAGRLENFDRLWQLELPAESQLNSVARAKVHGIPSFCFTVRGGKAVEIRSCFDPVTHLLISRNVKIDSVVRETWFLDYKEIDGVRFPSTIRFLQTGAPAIEARNIVLVKMPFDAAHFAVPPGAREFHFCRDPHPAKLVRTVEPHHPTGLLQSEVHVLFTIGEDGVPRDLLVISGHPVLAQAALEAIRQWRYTPEMCPSGPVPEHTTVKLNFTVR